ncbi:MAG TPA: acetoacetate decarboxylase family protein [Mycobacteriales bacterium]|nr:acetoacetate decarboxylase family protein [Mycobacteriales bacterium]
MTFVAPYAVTAAAGLPETRLPAELVRRLPDSVAPAPWQTRCQVVTWWHRPHRDAVELLPEPLRATPATMVIWALVRYRETPVGPYSEIAATVAGPGHIPFIVVDSLPSIVGGRANWLLPKALARFDWSADEGAVTIAPEQPAEPSWQIAVRARRIGPAFPSMARTRGRQVTEAGEVRSFAGRMRGLARYTKVVVDARADGPLSGLLRSGEFRGVTMTRARFTAGGLDPA